MRAFLAIPDSERPPAGAPTYVPAWVDALQRYVPRALSGAVLSGFVAAQLVYGAADGSLTNVGSPSWNGSTLAITGAATISTTLGVTGTSTFTGAVGFGGGAVSSLSPAAVQGFSGITGTTAIGVFVNAAGPSTATSALRGAQFSLTGAASTTHAEATGFLCGSISPGAAGTLTRVQSAWLNTQSGSGTNTCALLISGSATYTGAWAIRSEATEASYLAGALTIASSTASSSTSTGALVVTGGVGVGGAAYIGGVLRVTDTTASTLTSNGCAVFSGGVGIGGALNTGDTFTIRKTTTSTAFNEYGAYLRTFSDAASNLTHKAAPAIVMSPSIWNGASADVKPLYIQGLGISGTNSAYEMRFGSDDFPTILSLRGDTGETIHGGNCRLATSTVGALPTAGTAGRIRFATNGRKNGEGAGSGTGVLVFDDGTAWRACDTGATVAA